jgi:hypothetical protein
MDLAIVLQRRIEVVETHSLLACPTVRSFVQADSPMFDGVENLKIFEGVSALIADDSN